MAEPVVATGAGPRAAHGDEGPGRGAVDEARFAELRRLIVGPEQVELRALRTRVTDPSLRLRDVSLVLPDAIAERAGDPKLARALAPPIEEAITASVRRDPRPLADALFPAIGPAIRKAIAHTLASMMESLNRTVEQSVSWRAVRWRWTALRTGKPFAEIVLLETLQYRVEQLLLIHRETGLLLQHVTSEASSTHDADQVSAMLTAIRDFVHDSFHVPGEEGLDALRVGDLQVIVEQGPHAVLAAVVRGTAPAALRATFQSALETVHLQLGPELGAFRGDASPFERARPTLELCLVSQARPRRRSVLPRVWLTLAALLFVALAVWAFLAWRDWQRWHTYVERLRAEPGLVVLASGRENGRFFVAGLRDPLATDPATLIAATGLSTGAVEGRWEPYQAIHPRFVSARASELLRPPPGVSLQADAGTLVARGDAPAWWVAESERLAPAIAGVQRFEYAGPAPEDRLAAAVERASLRFPKGSSSPLAAQAEVAALASALRELDEYARARRRRVQVDVVGHTDSDGLDAANVPLSEARANAALAVVGASRFGALDFVVVPAGSREPLTPGTTEDEKALNRRASFRVVWTPGGPQGTLP